MNKPDDKDDEVKNVEALINNTPVGDGSIWVDLINMMGLVIIPAAIWVWAIAISEAGVQGRRSIFIEFLRYNMCLPKDIADTIALSYWPDGMRIGFAIFLSLLAWGAITFGPSHRQK